MNLTEFLLARIAEDEAAAKNRAQGAPIHEVGCYYYNCTVSPRVWTEACCDCTNETRARGMTECESKRRIVERHNHRGYVCEDGLNLPRESEWLDILHLLALPYRVHPDYDPAWAL